MEHEGPHESRESPRILVDPCATSRTQDLRAPIPGRRCRSGGRAIDAYRNADGGFGQALEPDCRTPHSQPEATRWALAVLDAAGCLTEERARGCADWLASVSTPDGGVPFCLTSVDGYPKAPWWTAVPDGRSESDGESGRAPATACARPSLGSPGGGVVLGARARGCNGESISGASVGRLSDHRTGSGARTTGLGRSGRGPCKPVALCRSIRAAQSPKPDTHTPLQFAPSPEHPLRRFFSDATIEGFLDRLIADQQEDGGWPIDWPAPGTTATNEWRAIRTLEALQTLSAYGRL